MISMAAASLVLPFLPLLAKQILLNNFLSDIPAMAIASDNVDREWVERPRRWAIGSLRSFMAIFGSISSVFDFLTFGVLIWVFSAGEELFRTGWFVESLVTELATVLVIRTYRPFYRSAPGKYLAVLAVVMMVSSSTNTVNVTWTSAWSAFSCFCRGATIEGENRSGISQRTAHSFRMGHIR